MATSSTTPSSTPSSTSTSTSTSTAASKKPASTKLQKAGTIVELSGAASLLTASALAIGSHHYPIAAALIGGAVAVEVGLRLRKG